jgi:hypothetical protein
MARIRVGSERGWRKSDAGTGCILGVIRGGGFNVSMEQASRRRPLERWSGWLFLVAASSHGALAPEHFSQWWGYGLFFLGAASLQMVWGLALLTNAINPRDSGRHWHGLTTWFYLMGILGNTFALALYVVTRTVGIPYFGTLAGEVECVAPIDVVTKAAELATVILLVIALRRHRSLRRQPE